VGPQLLVKFLRKANFLWEFGQKLCIFFAASRFEDKMRPVLLKAFTVPVDAPSSAWNVVGVRCTSQSSC
jgi:hypothetical protein